MAAMRRYLVNFVRVAVKWLFGAADGPKVYQNVIEADLHVREHQSSAHSAICFDASSLPQLRPSSNTCTFLVSCITAQMHFSIVVIQRHLRNVRPSHQLYCTIAARTSPQRYCELLGILFSDQVQRCSNGKAACSPRE